jgi:uncharacterized protein (TIGR02145 family)
MKKSVVLKIIAFIVFAGVFNSCTKDEEEDFFSGPSGTFIDTRDNTEYEWVRIGDQIWMAENLAYLPSVSPSADRSNTDPNYYVYGYEGSNVSEAKAADNYKTYGVLYNWSAAMAGSASSTTNPSGVQGACPTGWHLPSDDEWTQLTDYLGGSSVAGGKLKETGTTHWNSPNEGATNETGFTALPGGYLYGQDYFDGIAQFSLWWSSTEDESGGGVWYRSLSYSKSNLQIETYDKSMGLYVRCVKAN